MARMTEFQKRLWKLAKDYGNARVDLAFKGTCHPDEHADIESAYMQARTKLIEVIKTAEEVSK